MAIYIGSSIDRIRDAEPPELGRDPRWRSPTEAGGASTCGGPETAWQRALDAQEEFARYLRRGIVDLDRHKQLADALRAAVDNYIDKLSADAG
jgi:hypothetical protein